MEKKISLARAFIIRKRLKNDLDNLSRELTVSEMSLNAEDYTPIELDGVKTDFANKLAKFVSLSNVFADFNTAIDAANAHGPRSYLNRIETTRRKMNLFKFLGDKLENFKAEQKCYDSYEYNPDTKALGVYKTRHYVKRSDSDFKAMFEEEKKNLQFLEDSLSDENSKTFITFSEPLVEYLVTNGYLA